jgi:hypothetical protein
VVTVDSEGRRLPVVSDILRTDASRCMANDDSKGSTPSVIFGEA